MPRLRRRCDSVHPLHFRGRSSSAERSFDMREAKRAALFVPTIFEGIAQLARADASHASGQRCKSFYPHHFCPCGVVQTTCLPLMQEIAGAKPVRDAILHLRFTIYELRFGGRAQAPRCNSGWGLQFLGEWLSGNSRPHRSRICEPWRCKSSLAHQFQGIEATADRHRTFNPVG